MTYKRLEMPDSTLIRLLLGWVIVRVIIVTQTGSIVRISHNSE